MIRNWENWKYAHSMTKASISLPRSCRWVGPMTFDIGSVRASSTMTAMVKAMEARPWPPSIRMP